MSTTDRTGDRLAELAGRLVAAVRHGDPHDGARMLARLDRAELEHVALLLAASMPDGRPAAGRRPLPPVVLAELLAERYQTGRAGPARIRTVRR